MWLKISFDGDTGSATSVMSKEATEENRKRLGSREHWVGIDGGLVASYDYDTLAYVVTNLTGRFKHGRRPETN